MAGPLLASKTHRPRQRVGQVQRTGLLETLDAARDASVVLVSAPAGFGKTTLVTQWLNGGQRPVAWLSVDSRDNEPVTFWRYVIAALRTVAADVGTDAVAQLELAQPSVEGALGYLANDLHALAEDTVLVLDDYDQVESAEIHEGMAFLVEHLPRGLQLVLVCRANPRLPLARLRVRGALAEVRATDLRFSIAETTAYLTEVMGLSLSVQDVTTLEGRTEGWIAALQLAALSLRARPDAAAFIADFAGDDRYVVDFLVEEVLAGQAEELRSFLLHTSVLRTMSGPLCDAVTGREDSATVLRGLDRENLFVVPLDDRRRSYRYHHLFGDVLHARLLEEEPHLVQVLNRRASAWHELAGDRRESIRHALAGADFEVAADLLERELGALQRDRQEATLRRWIDALPDEVIQVRPVLTIAYVGSRMVRGELDGLEERLKDAERWLAACAESDGSRPAGMVVSDEERFRALPASVAMFRAAQARIYGDVPGTIRHARHALDLVGSADVLERGAASALLGLALWTSGDLAAAQRCYVDAMGVFERMGYRSDVAGCAIAATDMLLTRGHLRAARNLLLHVLDLVDPAGGPLLRGANDMHVALSQVLHEQGDHDGAVAHLISSRDLGEHLALPQNAYRSRVTTAQLRRAEGDLDGALVLLEEAERVYVGDFSPNVRPVPATRVRFQLARGDLHDALDWARRQVLSAGDDLSYAREYEHVTLARVLLAQHTAEGGARHLSDAGALLERLLTAARDGGRLGTVLEVLLLLALARKAAGDRDGARTALHEAVSIAGPEGYVRAFAAEGAPLTALLADLSTAGVGAHAAYVRRLLAACARPTSASPAAALASPSPPDASAVIQQPLSDRELDVMRLLAGELDGPGIARQLVVSVHTVRTHTKNIYAKLGVNSRRAAVHRATELNFLPGTSRR